MRRVCWSRYRRPLGLVVAAALVLAIPPWAAAQDARERPVHEERPSEEVRVAEAHGEPTVALARELEGLGDRYSEAGELEKAAAAYTRALDAWERSRGPDNPAVATCLGLLASVERRAGRVDRAEALLVRALAIRERVYGTRSSELISTLNNLGGVYILQGRHDDARRLLMRGLTIAEAAEGASRSSTAAYLKNLATLYRAEGRVYEAEYVASRLEALAAGPASHSAPAARGEAAGPVAPSTANGRLALERERDGLKGAVRTVSVELVRFATVDGRSVETARRRGPVTTYDERGDAVSRRLFYPDSALVLEERFERTGDGETAVSRSLHDGARRVTDEDEDVIVRVVRRGDGSGRLVDEAVYDEEDRLESRTVWRYSEDGRRVEVDHFATGNQRLGREILVHDARGLLVSRESSSFDPEVVTHSTFEHELDSHGNWTRRVEYDVDPAQKGAARRPVVAVYRQIVYF